MTLPLTEMGQKFADMLPRPIRDARTVHSVLDVLAREFDIVYEAVDDLILQMFVQTATWSLDSWESRVGLPVSPVGTDDETRRLLILSRLVSRFTSGREGMASTIHAISDTAKITVDYANREVRVRLSYNPSDSARTQIEKLIRDIVPSHLNAAVDYTTFIAGIAKSGDAL